MDPSTAIPLPFTAPDVPMPPGGPIEIAFSFDTTGSMSECLDRVRAQLAEVIQRLTADIPGLRIAVFAHGDYCDEEMYGYVTKHVDFTNDVGELCRFVSEVNGTGGGDFEECYELVLRQAWEQLSWQPGTQRALVMIGDATPHEVGSEQNVHGIDWRQETQRLVANGVHIYAVQCLNNPEADSFYRQLADSTGGNHLKLDELSNIVDIMMAICYREKGVEYFEAYEQEVRARDGSAIRADVDRMFISLRDQAEAGPSSSPSDVTPDVTYSDDDVESNSGHSDVFPAPATPGTSFMTPPVPRTSRPRAGSVSSRGSVTSSRSTGSSRSRRSTGGMLTRSRAHPMTLRRREPRTSESRRNKPKQTPIQRCYEKALRERQTGEDFPLANLPWSRWQQAMTPPTTTTTTTPSGSHDNWQKRPGDRVGERRRRLFDGNMAVPAVYEVAVQAPNSQTKTPVLGSVTGGFRGRHWEAALLSSPHVRRTVDDVLQKGCKLYVRRAPVSQTDVPLVTSKYGLPRTPVKAGTSTAEVTTPTSGTTSSALRELRGLMTKTCDYAWNRRLDYHKVAYVHRQLVRKGLDISMSK